MSDFDMFKQSLSINCRQMNGASNQPPVIPSPRLGDLSVTDNGDYSANAEGYDGYANVDVEVSGSSKTVINLHFEYDETMEKDTVTIDVPYETAVNAILSGSYEFIITDYSISEGEPQPVCAGAWLWYDTPESPCVIVSTMDWSSSGRSYWFSAYPEFSGVCIMPYPGEV